MRGLSSAKCARYNSARVSEGNQGRDQFAVWALPGQCWLSEVYLRIPSLPITSR